MRGFMPGLLIPDDWNEGSDGFCTLTATVPNSAYWRATLRGALLNLSLEYQWDAQTGDPEQAAAIGQNIFDTINFDCS